MATIRGQVSLRYYAHPKTSRGFVLDSWYTLGLEPVGYIFKLFCQLFKFEQTV
jgi:hypothetical protein